MNRSLVKEETGLSPKNGTNAINNETGESRDHFSTINPSTGHQKITSKTTEANYKPQILWINVVFHLTIHAIGLYGIFCILTFKSKLINLIFQMVYGAFSLIGVTVGVHRLWSHRSYKANLPLRIFLMLAQTAALQNDIYKWARDHRVHHKFTETNADPHNVTRGFFFSHVGWLMCTKHPDVKAKGKMIDMSDVLADPVVRFQIKYYLPMIVVFNLLIPILSPWYFFGENLWIAFATSLARYVISLNGVWLINSAAHTWGMKPYDKSIKSVENGFVIFLRLGEGFHNYHHTFPWDYKTSEFGNYSQNLSTAFLDLMAKIGWATDLKTASEDTIRNRALRTGDGSWPNSKQGDEQKSHQHKIHPHDDAENIWGWGDKDMSYEDMKSIERNNIKTYA